MNRDFTCPSTFTALVILAFAFVLTTTTAENSIALGGKNLSSVSDLVTEAKSWYMANRANIGKFSCCGKYTGGYPGNVNCDEEGKRNLEDVICLIGRIYHLLPPGQCVSCCPENANVNADPEGKRNLADITKLIDHIYISKRELQPCL